MSINELFATAAHLHVLLRRNSGRVTDTEWKTSNPECARAMVALASEVAKREGLEELQHLADKFAALIPSMSAPVRKPLLAAAAARFAAGEPLVGDERLVGHEPPDSGFQVSSPALTDNEAAAARSAALGRRCVGGIR
ncbi:MAG: hypothetical protein WEK74_12010 [Hydrogenophaga sp.]